MLPDLTISDVLKRLEDWRLFPKYQLERRVDIFLTFFLEPFFAREGRLFRDGSHAESDVELVAPEFPLLSRIQELVPKREPAASAPLRADDVDARTVNADYLLFRRSPRPAWLLVELKTDSASFDEKQLRRYEAARQLGMNELRAHLEVKVLDRTDDEEKYEHLLDRLKPFPVDVDTVEVVYLAPELPKKKLGIVPAAEWTYGDPAPRLHRLSAFAEVGPFEPSNAWEPLARLLRKISPG